MFNVVANDCFCDIQKVVAECGVAAAKLQWPIDAIKTEWEEKSRGVLDTSYGVIMTHILFDMN